MRNYTLACIIPFLLTLGAFGQKPEELIERLKDSEEETRAAAARALGSQKVGRRAHGGRWVSTPC